MHVKEIYVIFIHLFDSGILLIIDLNTNVDFSDFILVKIVDVGKQKNIF
jgi:hypothetical protein